MWKLSLDSRIIPDPGEGETSKMLPHLLRVSLNFSGTELQLWGRD